MTTVGYGEFYVRTHIGRVIIFMVCIFGILILSMMVVTLTSRVTTTPFEGKAITVLQKLEARNFMREEAGNAITIFLKILIL